MASSVEKTIAEPETVLQQNIDIPGITLQVHPYVAIIIKKCADEGRKPKFSDFSEKVKNSDLLNQLQRGVNRWIEEIQKVLTQVTNLDRDPSGGTALEEINYWLNLETVLHQIEEKRESLEVALTLDILKHGKRSRITVSFDTDTDLRQAFATMNDCKPIMKDLPLNDLLSATDLESIRASVQPIFEQLLKLGSSRYPTRSCLRFVKTISKDLAAQLTKVLGTRQLMHIPYDDFENIMVQCFELFATWDDEYKNLRKSLMENIMKTMPDEHITHWRNSTQLRILKNRLRDMRKCRQIHQQIGSVMAKVLRPTIRETTAPIEGEELEPSKAKISLDAADANAIEEVNLAYEILKELGFQDNTLKTYESWVDASSSFEQSFEHLETCLTTQLRDQLDTAKNANEMFNIFRITALYDMPCIQKVITEYQMHIIQQVKNDVATLHEKCKNEDKDIIIPLVAGMRRDVQNLIQEGASLVWESYELDVQKFSETIVGFQEKVEELSVIGEQLEGDVRSLETCPYSANTFADILSKIQHAVDDLSLKQYSDLDIWVNRLNEEVEEKLAHRLQAGIQTWTDALAGTKDIDHNMDTDAPVQPTHKPGGDPQIEIMIHEVRITNQTMDLCPIIEKARNQIMQQLFAWQGIVTSQLMLQSSRYQVGIDKPVRETYRNILTKLPSGPQPMNNANNAIASKIEEVEKYVNQWLPYQASWDLLGQLGEDIGKWMRCLNDIETTRSTLDTLDTRREFGPIVIDFAKVQREYDSRHKETLSKIDALLGKEKATFHTSVSMSRSDLE